MKFGGNQCRDVKTYSSYTDTHAHPQMKLYIRLAVVPVLRTGCPTFLIHFQPVFSNLFSALLSQTWYLCASASLILCLFNAWGVYSLIRLCGKNGQFFSLLSARRAARRDNHRLWISIVDFGYQWVFTYLNVNDRDKMCTYVLVQQSGSASSIVL